MPDDNAYFDDEEDDDSLLWDDVLADEAALFDDGMANDEAEICESCGGTGEVCGACGFAEIIGGLCDECFCDEIADYPDCAGAGFVYEDTD